MQRELQLVRDEAKAAVINRERLSQELQTKQAQVCSLEGQLDAARTLNNKLSQEVKRLEPSKSSSNLYQRQVFFLNCNFSFFSFIFDTCKTQLIVRKTLAIDPNTVLCLPLRLEAELEKLQNSSRSTDATPFSTPCWSATSPWEHSGTVL